MKNSFFALLIAIILGFSGCGLNKDAEVNSFVTEMDNLTVEIVRTVDEKPMVGVDQAQQLLNQRKPKLKANFDKLKDVHGFQLSEEMKKKFTEAITKNVELVNNLQIKYAEEAITDQGFGEKLGKLTADFNSIFGV